MNIYDSRGFTIMEVLIAMAIFAIGILGVAKLQITSTSDNTTSRTMTEGAAVAAGNSEAMIVYDYDNTYLKDTVSDPDLPDNTETVVGFSGVTYTINTTINDDTPMKNVKQIKTEVIWHDQGNVQKSFTTVTYKAE